MTKHSITPESRDPSGQVPTLGLCRKDAAAAIGVSVRTIDMLIAGRLGNDFPVIFIGRKPIVVIDLLQIWLEKQLHEKNGSRQQ